MHAFRSAVEAGDVDGAIALLDEDVEFRSPAVFKPYRGREAVGVVLRAVFEVFEDFTYQRQIGTPDGNEHALVFTARVGEKLIEGCDLITEDGAGHISELVVMVRPLSGILALADAMSAMLAKQASRHGV